MKHEKIIKSSNYLEEALQALDKMIKMLEGIDMPVEESVKSGTNIPLADFLNSQSSILDKYVEVIYGMKIRLETCFLDDEVKENNKIY